MDRSKMTVRIVPLDGPEAGDPRMGGTVDVPVRFLGRDAFLKNKCTSGRPKDLEDIRSLGG